MIRILQGDCREVLKQLPDNSIQCCVSSPPYYGLRSYGIGTENGEIGLEENPADYVAELVGVFREVRRVLRDDGTLWLNLGSSYASKPFAPWGIKPKDDLCIPHRVAFAMQLDGWYLRSPIVWAKPSCMPESVRDRPTNSYEMVFLLSKRASYYFDSDAVREDVDRPELADKSRLSGVAGLAGQRGDVGRYHAYCAADLKRNLRNVWTIAIRPEGISHFALMPPDLAERCVRAGSSERGQCPHCGAPWARVVERVSAIPARTGDWKSTDQTHRNDIARKGGFYDASATTTGWQPTCACPEHTPVPQTVLDPFSGAGTTLMVADRLRRNAVGIELNPAYAKMSRDRLTDDCPMFAELSA